MWNTITNPFPNFIPHFIIAGITYPCWDSPGLTQISSYGFGMFLCFLSATRDKFDFDDANPSLICIIPVRVNAIFMIDISRKYIAARQSTPAPFLMNEFP